MAYRTIAVIVTDAATDRAALAAAAAIALRDGAHLDVHCIGVDPARYDAMPAGTAAIVLESGAAEARAQADDLVVWAERALPSELVRVAVQSLVVPQLGLDSIVARLSRYSDLIVAPKPYGAGRDALNVSVVESALFGTGAPVMIVPDGVADLSRPWKRIVVAWNESDESLSAIRKALPFLCAATHVDLVMVDPPSHSPERSDPGGAITLMLARHGIKAEVSILARTLPKVSEVIARFAREHGADAVVMGAYGHSRFREAILGGATRDLLESAPLPLVMAH